MRDVAKVNTHIAVAATSTTVLAANRSRESATISNDSAVVIYLSLATSPNSTIPTAIVGDGLRLPAGGSITIEDFTGAVAGISTSGTNNVCLTEV